MSAVTVFVFVTFNLKLASVCRAHTSIVASVLPRARPDSDHQMARPRRRGRRRLPVPLAVAGAMIIIMMIRVTGIAAAAASHCAIRRRRGDPDRDSDSESGRDSERAPTVALSGSAAPAGLRPPARLLPGSASAGGPLQWRQAGGPDPGRLPG